MPEIPCRSFPLQWVPTIPQHNFALTSCDQARIHYAVSELPAPQLIRHSCLFTKFQHAQKRGFRQRMRAEVENEIRQSVKLALRQIDFDKQANRVSSPI